MLYFQINFNGIPDPEFLKADITTDGGERVLIFASDYQLGELSKKKTWFMDGTFKAAKTPFMQLYTINGFVRQGSCQKQVPLVYALMTKRRASDYIKVGQNGKSKHPGLVGVGFIFDNSVVSTGLNCTLQKEKEGNTQLGIKIKGVCLICATEVIVLYRNIEFSSTAFMASCAQVIFTWFCSYGPRSGLWTTDLPKGCARRRPPMPILIIFTRNSEVDHACCAKISTYLQR